MESVFTPSTLIPAGLAFGAVLMAIGAAWRAATKLARIDSRLEAMQQAQQRNWTLADQLSWTWDLRAAHPELTVPKPVLSIRSEPKEEP